MKNTKKEDGMTFEAAMTRLEEIVRLLEADKATLDDSLKLYEEGVGLVKFCNARLDDAEQKVTLLSKNPDGTVSGAVMPPMAAGGEEA